jgi:N-acetyl-alpha-D-glucosaminyl L-malate synthase BshA
MMESATRRMNVGIVCYPSVGGSGVVATELGKWLARNGHQVHFISSEAPFRLGAYQPGITFHAVHTPGYPLFREPQYLLSLTNRIVQVSRETGLDVVHAHYAIPHAAAAYLAKQILTAQDGTRVPKIVTTLHGTDITILGSDPSYSETVAFCIEGSDAVTAVSESLKQDTYRELHVRKPIEVIPNFLDCEVHRRQFDPELRARFCPPDRFSHLVIHVSNFRPVKRVDLVVEVFRRIAAKLPARLLLVGDGPELDRTRQLLRENGLADRAEALGEQDQVVSLLSASDLFLLPSAQESFGLAALEAMACEVPVVASRVGGVPEVIEHGTTGFLHQLDDVEGMADSGVAVLSDNTLRRRIARTARDVVVERFCAERVVPMYERFYQRIIR